ncbi:GntR family transcriptional regulator [Vibrio sp. F13]|uniref:GntR family transcriptional regulator n=1 Tax=unclassified Vibrio TaxID=2614977 RepID=UPI0010BD6253|nr:GntR family transcriptional regulator [Vibrio sp. F13]TKF87644.1 GntR family transcriptional regulator [Vibrio sp. F13]
MTEWKDDQPIFRQLAAKISDQILQGVWVELQALPSVRAVAADLKINHLTVMKSYQLLVDEGLVEKKRGQGMYVAEGALQKLKESAHQSFINTQIPAIAETLSIIDMSVEELVKQLAQHIKDKS